MTCSEGSFVWYELMTTDPDGAAGFYGPVVGWSVSGHSDPAETGGVDYRMIVRGDGGHAGGVLGLSQDMQNGGARPCWLGYLSADDVDAKVADILADGGKLQMPAVDLPVGRMAMVADPQGVPFYVMKPIPPADAPEGVNDVFSPTEAQHVRWNELSTSDDAAATAFYAKHFGWTQEGGMPMGELGEYRFIQKDGVGIGAIMRMMPEAPMAAWTFYIGVDDIDRAASAIAANGGQVVHGPMEIPGGEYALNGIDPQGAHFGLVGPKAS